MIDTSIARVHQRGACITRNQRQSGTPAISDFQNFPLTAGQISTIAIWSRPTEGRLAIVTDAGRDAVDAAAPLTNGAGAYGEVVSF
jgi:hypothetical protein